MKPIDTADTVAACPNCDSSRVVRRTDSLPDTDRRADTRWYCRDCPADFDEPISRDPHREHSPVPDHVADLLDADPEEYPK